jgi:hypothetical protein
VVKGRERGATDAFATGDGALSAGAVQRLDPLPGARRCSGCGGELRFSHVAYVGRGEGVAVHVCRRCGLAYRGAPRHREESEGRRENARRSRRPLPEGGPPENPVIDEATARLLRERLEG